MSAGRWISPTSTAGPMAGHTLQRSSTVTIASSSAMNSPAAAAPRRLSGHSRPRASAAWPGRMRAQPVPHIAERGVPRVETLLPSGRGGVGLVVAVDVVVVSDAALPALLLGGAGVMAAPPEESQRSNSQRPELPGRLNGHTGSQD